MAISAIPNNNCRDFSGVLDGFIAPTGGVTLGFPKKIGAVVVMPLETVSATATFKGRILAAHANKIHKGTKVGSQAWAVGQAIYFNTTNGFTTAATGNTLVGIAAVAVGSGAGETTGEVLPIGA